MDHLTIMWEGFLPRKGVEMLREEKLVGILPHSHSIGRSIYRNCPIVSLGQLFPRRGRRDIYKVLL
jgi:hypothetical protein